jgi:hypothetical protein
MLNRGDDYDESKRSRKRMPTFNRDKKTYRSFMTIFEAWEDKEDIQRATLSQAMLADLPTDQEYWDGSQ